MLSAIFWIISSPLKKWFKEICKYVTFEKFVKISPVI